MVLLDFWLNFVLNYYFLFFLLNKKKNIPYAVFHFEIVLPLSSLFRIGISSDDSRFSFYLCKVSFSFFSIFNACRLLLYFYFIFKSSSKSICFFFILKRKKLQTTPIRWIILFIVVATSPVFFVFFKRNSFRF